MDILYYTYPNSCDCELVLSYVDDVLAGVSSVNYHTATTFLAELTEDVQVWARKRQLQISAQKSQITSDTHQYHHHPQVRLSDTTLPIKPYLTILVVTFGPIFSFSKHNQNILSCARKPNKVLKALE